jgi:hypothetical protein
MSGDENISDEEAEVEEKPKLSGREKGMRIKEAIRRARGEKGLPARGNYSSPDAEGPAVDIRGSVIREVEDMGIADPNLKDNYKPSGYTGWKRFANKGRKKYANGGGIGSMMQPKKKTNKAVDLLQAKAPEGEFLAYINQGEAAMLKRAGGSGEPVNGIPSFRPQDMGNAANQAASAANTGVGGGYNISNNNNNGPDRSYVTAQQQANHVAAQAAAKETMEKATRRKEILSKINPITGIYSLLNKNPLSMLGSMFGKGFKGLTGKMRGINPETGLPNTQAEYEQNRYDRQQIGRLDNLYAAKDKGYNSLFGMKTNDFTPGQQSKIDSLERNYDPTTARNVDSGRGSGLRNTVAANSMGAKVTMANGQTITSDQINEFGDNRNINMDEFGYGGAYGTPDQGFVNDPYGTPDQGFQGIGETTASLTNRGFNSDIAPQFQNLVSQAGINDAQKSIINQAINNAQMSGTDIPAGMYDQAKQLDTKAKSGFLGFGKTEADPMTQQEYKDYLVSQGYI